MMRRCDRTDWHVSHQWGIEYADMGTIWEDCPGLSSWETDDRGVAPHPTDPSSAYEGGTKPEPTDTEAS